MSTKKYGLASQLRALRELAEKRGHDVTNDSEFIDDGYSGATLDRPALDRLRQAVRDKVVGVVLVHDPDRLSRKLSYQLLLTEEFERLGAAVEYVTTPREDAVSRSLGPRHVRTFARALDPFLAGRAEPVEVRTADDAAAVTLGERRVIVNADVAARAGARASGAEVRERRERRDVDGVHAGRPSDRPASMMRLAPVMHQA